MSEKKRKRREDGGDRPKKKVATAPVGRVQVEMLENKEPLGPVLGMREAIEGVAYQQQLTEE
jgi:DNA-directed RNA polymerase I subunit RPA49